MKSPTPEAFAYAAGLIDREEIAMLHVASPSIERRLAALRRVRRALMAQACRGLDANELVALLGPPVGEPSADDCTRALLVLSDLARALANVRLKVGDVLTWLRARAEAREAPADAPVHVESGGV